MTETRGRRAAGARPGRRRACTPTSSTCRSSPGRWRRSRCCPRRGSRCSRRTPTRILERGRDRVPRRARRARALRGRGRGRRRRARAVPARALPLARPGDGAAQFTQVARNRANDVVFGGHGHDLRARVRLAVRPRPRRRPPLRDDRGLPQLREARLRLAVAPPLGRHRLRAGRPARQQAPLRHGLRAHPLLGQAVHGLGHAARARAETRSTWRGSCSARTSSSEHTVVFSLINANSPLVWDATMLGAARAYAEANQAVMMTPFILAGAMSPVDGRRRRARRRSPSRWPGWRTSSSSGRARRSCSARSPRRCRCSRARRPSARRSRRSCST